MERLQAASRHTGGKEAFYLLLGLLVYAPLIRGGNRPLPLLSLELASLLLLGHLFWRPQFKYHLAPLLGWTLVAIALWPLLQLVPLPFASWQSLPGREYYAQALSQVSPDFTPAETRAISLIPFATETAWLALLPPLMVFLVAVGLPTQQLQRLAVAFIGVASAQAVLGLLQYGDGPGSIFYLGNTFMAGSAAGTYINRNHLAGLLEMALPVALALLALSVGRSRHSHPRRHRSRKKNRNRRFTDLSAVRLNKATLYGAASLAILLGLVFTRSRAGVALAMLGILLSTLVFSHRLGGKNVYGLIGTLTAIGMGLATLIGLVPVLTRFAYEDPVASRWPIFSSTLHAIGEFFPLGSGAGAYIEVFQRFHPLEIAGVVINHAHNDYLEWVLGNGLPATGLLMLVGVCYLRQWPKVWYAGHWSAFRFVQAGSGISLFLMAMHTCVDFNLHIPANAIFMAFLAAVFFHRHQEEQSRRDDSLPSASADTGEVQQSLSLPPENRMNPFAGL